MANMGHCRFQNTLRDLEDCLEHILDHGMSMDETRARAKLVEACRDVVQTWDDEQDHAEDPTE